MRAQEATFILGVVHFMMEHDDEDDDNDDDIVTAGCSLRIFVM